MVLKVYGYVQAWGLPDISPYVTKLIFYLTIMKIPFEYVNEDLPNMDNNSPYGKLPYIVDDDGLDCLSTSSVSNPNQYSSMS